MPRVIRVALVSMRDLMLTAGPFILIAVALLVGAYALLDPTPPRRVVLATGPELGAYAKWGELYAAELRRFGIQVELRDEKFNPIPGRTFADADNLYGDDVAKTVTWNSEDDLNAYFNQPVHLRFRLRAAKLFAIAAVSL